MNTAEKRYKKYVSQFIGDYLYGSSRPATKKMTFARLRKLRRLRKEAKIKRK